MSNKILFVAAIVAVCFPSVAFAASKMNHIDGTVWEIYVLGNGFLVADILKGVKSLVEHDGFRTPFIVVGIIAFFAAGVSALTDFSKMRRMFTVLMVIWGMEYAVFELKSDVIVVDLYHPSTSGSAVGTTLAVQKITIENVPSALVVPASIVTTFGNEITAWFEAVFSTVYTTTTSSFSASGGGLPSSFQLSQGSPYSLASSLLKAASTAVIVDVYLATNVQTFFLDCVTVDLALGNTLIEDVIRSTNILAEIAPSTMVGGFITEEMAATGNTVVSCDVLYASIQADFADNDVLSAMVERSGAGALKAMPTGNLLSGYVSSATNLITGGMSGGQAVAQSAMVDALNKSYENGALATGSSDMLMSLAINQARHTQKSSWITGAEVFKDVAGITFSVLQAILFGLSPLVMILFAIPGMGLSIFGNFIRMFFWLALWEPMLAICNYASMMFLSSKSSTNGGVYSWSADNIGAVTELASSTSAFAGYAVALVPLMSWAIVKGTMAFTEMISSGVGNQFAAKGAEMASTGNVSLGNTNMNNIKANSGEMQHTLSTGQATPIVHMPANMGNLNANMGVGGATFDGKQPITVKKSVGSDSTSSGASTQMEIGQSSTAASHNHTTTRSQAAGKNLSTVMAKAAETDSSTKGISAETVSQMNAASQEFVDSFKDDKSQKMDLGAKISSETFVGAAASAVIQGGVLALGENSAARKQLISNVGEVGALLSERGGDERSDMVGKLGTLLAELGKDGDFSPGDVKQLETAMTGAAEVHGKKDENGVWKSEGEDALALAALLSGGQGYKNAGNVVTTANAAGDFFNKPGNNAGQTLLNDQVGNKEKPPKDGAPSTKNEGDVNKKGLGGKKRQDSLFDGYLTGSGSFGFGTAWTRSDSNSGAVKASDGTAKADTSTDINMKGEGASANGSLSNKEDMTTGLAISVVNAIQKLKSVTTTDANRTDATKADRVSLVEEASYNRPVTGNELAQINNGNNEIDTGSVVQKVNDGVSKVPENGDIDTSHVPTPGEPFDTQAAITTMEGGRKEFSAEQKQELGSFLEKNSSSMSSKERKAFVNNGEIPQRLRGLDPEQAERIDELLKEPKNESAAVANVDQGQQERALAHDRTRATASNKTDHNGIYARLPDGSVYKQEQKTDAGTLVRGIGRENDGKWTDENLNQSAIMSSDGGTGGVLFSLGNYTYNTEKENGKDVISNFRTENNELSNLQDLQQDLKTEAGFSGTNYGGMLNSLDRNTIGTNETNGGVNQSKGPAVISSASHKDGSHDVYQNVGNEKLKVGDKTGYVLTDQGDINEKGLLVHTDENSGDKFLLIENERGQAQLLPISGNSEQGYSFDKPGNDNVSGGLKVAPKSGGAGEVGGSNPSAYIQSNRQTQVISNDGDANPVASIEGEAKPIQAVASNGGPTVASTTPAQTVASNRTSVETGGASATPTQAIASNGGAAVAGATVTPANGTVEDDGTVVLQNGIRENPNGTRTLASGDVEERDGSTTLEDGRIIELDGTERHQNGDAITTDGTFIAAVPNNDALTPTQENGGVVEPQSVAAVESAVAKSNQNNRNV